MTQQSRSRGPKPHLFSFPTAVTLAEQRSSVLREQPGGRFGTRSLWSLPRGVLWLGLSGDGVA